MKIDGNWNAICRALFVDVKGGLKRKALRVYSTDTALYKNKQNKNCLRFGDVENIPELIMINQLNQLRQTPTKFEDELLKNYLQFVPFNYNKN